MITKETTIEDLVSDFPDSVTFLMQKGIRCLRCGEPSWGTVESAAKEKNFTDKEIEEILNELNRLFNS